MARRKKGRPVNGWLVIDKPSGVGSTQVVSKARWALRAQKAGHAGTLDPLATGVLAIAFGEATKTVPYAMDGRKRYRFTARWGEVRDSDDADGAVVSTHDARPTRDAILAQLPSFIGEILQRPPDYSAVKIDGARAYDLARAGRETGETPDIAARPIQVDALELIEIPDPDHAVFEMICGKGGYVRSVARDLGVALGCGGHVSQLRRLSAGPFRIEDAIPFEKLDEFRNTERPERCVAPVAAGLDDIPAFDVSDGRAAQLKLGRAVPVSGALAASSLSYGDAAWARYDTAPVAVGVVKGGSFHPTRVFNLDASVDEDNEDPDVDHHGAQGRAH